MSLSTERRIPRVNPNVSYGLLVIMRHQCRFISRNGCTTLVGHVGSGGGYACLGEGGLWEISVPSTQFYYEPETAKIYSLLKNSKHKATLILQIELYNLL